MAVDTLARAIAAGKVPVTAYEYAVQKGYTGTEEEFATDMGNSATNATNAAASASEASASAASAVAAATNFAPAYSSSATYAVGDHVLYEGCYYVCNTAITTAEAWTAAHWTATKVGPEITELKTQVNGNVFPLVIDGEYTPSKTFVQGSFDGQSQPSLSARRICADFGFYPKNTKFDIACNGQYYQIQFFKHPIGTSNNEYASSPIAFTGGNTYSSFVVPVNSYIGFTVANGYNYAASTDIIPSDFAMSVVISTNIKKEIDNLVSELDGVACDYKIIDDNKLLRHNSYSYVSGGSLQYVYRTEMIPCTEGTVFKYFGRSDYDYDAVYWRNANKEPIGRGQTDHAIGEYTFTAPANTAYAEFSSYSAENFNVWIHGQKQVGNTMKLLTDIDAKTTNPLSGKSILFVGDSITEGLGYDGGWVTLIQSRNDCTCVNEGHGGWPIGNSADAESHYNTLAALVGRKTGTFDYVLLSGGYNDFTTSPRAEIGTLTPYTYSDLTRNTFAGDVEYYLRTARTKWINAKIGFILTMKKEFTDTSVNERQVTYWNIIRNACKKYSIPLLDLYNESGLVGVVVDGVTDLVTKTYYNASTTFPDGDGTHPNGAGYEYLYKQIVDFVKGL